MDVSQSVDQRNTGAPDMVRVFTDVLSRRPDALVAAISNEGILTTMPTSVPLIGQRIVIGRSLLDMVVATDKLAVIDTWDRTRVEGGASVIVHLQTDPLQPVLLTLVDARAEHTAFLAMMVPAGGASGRIAAGASAVTVAPRTARIRKNELAVITDIDAATTLILGWTPEQMIGKRSLDFVHPQDQERAMSNWMEMLTAPGHDQRVRLRHLAADDSWVWMEITNRNLLNDPQECVLADMLDVSDELAAQEALRANEKLLRRLAESLPLGVIQIEADHTISYSNARLSAITGAHRAKHIDEQFRHVLAPDDELLTRALHNVLDGGDDQDLEIRFLQQATISAQPLIRHCNVSMRSLTNELGVVTGAILCVADISDQVTLNAELERRATFDPLTGCLNRQAVMSRLEAQLTDPGRGVAIVFVDLDGFKEINDDLGHAAGDTLLSDFGQRLRESVRDGDIVGRVGGDEFLIVCAEVSDVDHAIRIAEHIEDAMERGFVIDGELTEVRASLGVARTADRFMTSDRLVAEADTRMYVQKRGRKHRRPGAIAERPSTLRTRANEESVALRRAIHNGELEVHYQPIIALHDNSVAGVEALVRWRRDGEIIPAIAFIGLAERSMLIGELGLTVVNDVTLAAAGFPESGPDLQWFINMSPSELAISTTALNLRDRLAQHCIAPDRVVIEITEHADLADNPVAMRSVEALAELGVGIALDDFGTGYSSLSLLRALPVTHLKFDRTFTMDLETDPVAGHLLECCHDLARRLGVTMIAEGVETEAQHRRVATAGIELAQGYLYAPALPLGVLRERMLTGAA